MVAETQKWIDHCGPAAFGDGTKTGRTQHKHTHRTAVGDSPAREERSRGPRLSTPWSLLALFFHTCASHMRLARSTVNLEGEGIKEITRGAPE